MAALQDIDEAEGTVETEQDPDALAAEIATLEKQVAEDSQAVQASEEVADASEGLSWWQPGEAMVMSGAILLFGAAVIAIAARTSSKGASLDSNLKLYGMIMIITMTGFLVVAGYDDQQIAAPLGLLGTVAGYLLGKAETNPAVRRDEVEAAQDVEAASPPDG